MKLTKKEIKLLVVFVVLLLLLIWLVHKVYSTDDAVQQSDAQPIYHSSVQKTEHVNRTIDKEDQVAAVQPVKQQEEKPSPYQELASKLAFEKLMTSVLKERAEQAALREKIGDVSAPSGLNALSADLSQVSNPEAMYSLGYVFYKNGQWLASVIYRGEAFNVTQGYKFANGAEVVGISDQGVAIQDHDHLIKLQPK